jgi:hypothetical protein
MFVAVSRVNGSDLLIFADIGSRRTLTDIKNLIGIASYPYVVSKKPMLH